MLMWGAGTTCRAAGRASAAQLALLILLASVPARTVCTSVDAECSSAPLLPLEDLIVARDADTRAICMNIMDTMHSSWSQTNQDTFVWHNFLASRYLSARAHPGFSEAWAGTVGIVGAFKNST